ncbi:MAG: bifunctional 2-polyprenyl-6-hydroxyphenol methylase/3-demethylubiquinol 3-O-methyltransferase UbiG [Desulfosarcina sp.]|nr:bifunctional 2-polyprenyl-6-hydroxyphenol methylase/3-demethylubiquinol 3-O-methyltransferase UbiG [Desulfosarcina sp.]MBC2743001.1 bifunctional 2-polyprenyl-6-hydroxyphenol methylase/3-demethylubiquinol 3-O-methyltransferase UbiG [Desulfosarcina sp.]MBC2765911.1 bifunctional 2-polyprenyl-6-hydroxyphenol methylase/3-demethylubiquinol 3-O-methyltransferase UbiG [Desulfosarcina sp.]
MNQSDNIDAGEIARFSAMADIWWDRKGEFKALHDINPVRLAYVRDRADLAGKRVLDVGCGGGLLSEALASCGARVTGIDMAEASLAVARGHMKTNGLTIDYRQITAEALADTIPGEYDVVTCMELLEHVPRSVSIIDACARLVRPGGNVFFATVNRTWLSWLLVIVVAEYVMGIVRKGTHKYSKLVRPEEVKRWGDEAGLTFENLSGLRYIPFGGHVALCRSTNMNYLMHFKRKFDGRRRHQ